MAETRVQIDYAKGYKFSRQVGEKFLRRALLEMKIEAVTILSRGEYTIPPSRLATSLDVTVHLGAQGIEGSLGSKLKYAASVEAGASPHYILPRPPRTRLKFFWRKVGRVVAPPFVYHPGQRGKRYLRGPLERIGHRYNMIVFTYVR